MGSYTLGQLGPLYERGGYTKRAVGAVIRKGRLGQLYKKGGYTRRAVIRKGQLL